MESSTPLRKTDVAFKPPRSISIGGIRFRIVIKKIDDYGQMSFDDREIRISRECLKSDKMLLDTLRHEMLHASLAVAGHSWSEGIDEEPIVRSIEHIFFPAIDALMNKIKL